MSVNLLKDLNFAEKINSTEAITEAGKEMLSNYRAYVYSNPANCSLVNGFVNEASKYSFDTGLVSILESVTKFIKENNISWKLASACESISANQSSYNYINQLGVEQVKKILEMNENDVITYIKAGALKNIQYIPEFRAICKEVYRTHITEAQAPNYNVINPISYVHVNEDTKDQYFNVLGKTFKISENKVEEAVCDDPTYVRMNQLISTFQRNDKELFIEMLGAHGDTCKFSINENEEEKTVINFTKGNINETFDTAEKLIDYCNTASRLMNVNEKMKFMQLASTVKEVFENYDNVVLLDPVKVISSNNGTVCAIIEAKDNVNLTVYRNIQNGTSSKNYDYMVEALNQVIKLTGIDLKYMFEDRINEDCKKADADNKEIREQLEANKTAQFDIRKKKIAMLAEQYKNDPVRIALLNNVAKQLMMLED